MGAKPGSFARFLCAEAGQGLPPFPAPLCPLAAFFLRCAPDRFLLTNPAVSNSIDLIKCDLRFISSPLLDAGWGGKRSKGR
jgi:hypothetical protein